MPGPARTKGALKNTRFKSRMRSLNRTRKRKQAFFIEKLDKKQKLEYFNLIAKLALLLSRKLEREGKIKPVESCDGSFDTYYNNKDSWKITHDIFKMITTSREAENTVHREFRQVSRKQPGMKFSLKVLLLFILTTLLRTTDAKWNELSSAPGEISAYDSTSAGLIALGILEIGGGFIWPPLAVLGTHTITCGLYARGVGSVHRLYNHATGTHPLSTGDVITESIGVVVPGTSSMARTAYHIPSATLRFFGSDALPKYSFNRNDPTLGENITPMLNPFVRVPVNIGASAYEAVRRKEVPESKRANIAQTISEVGQKGLEGAINHSAASGYKARGFAQEYKPVMEQTSKKLAENVSRDFSKMRDYFKS